MTRIYGYALDPESGAPQPRRQVKAALWPVTRATLQGPVADGADHVNSDTDGRWELNLLPTAGSGRVIRLRCTGLFLVYVDIPVAVTGGAGDLTAIDVSTLLVDPTTLDPIPNDPSVYLPRAELGQPNGVATLGADGKLTFAQRPPGSGGGGDSFEYTQASPAASWIIDHNLSRKVHVTVFDVLANVVYADVEHGTPNQATVTFADPFAGSAVLS